jgi:hypothetical protein
MSRKTSLGSRQPAHTGCFLEELTVTELVWWQLIFRGDIAYLNLQRRAVKYLYHTLF